MLSTSLITVLTNALPAGAIAGLGCAAVGGIPEVLRARSQAAILGLAVCVSLFLLGARPVFPPGELLESFLWVAILLAVFVVVRPASLGARYFLRALFVGLVGMLLFWHSRSALQGYVNTRNLAAFFCLALGVWSISERIVVNVGVLSLVGLPMLSVGSLTLFLLKRDNLPMAQIAGVVGGMVFALVVMALALPKRLSAAAAIPFVSVLVIALMAATHFTFHYNPWVMVTLCLPFAGLWVREVLPIPHQPLIEFAALASITMLPMAYLLGVFG